MKMPNKFFLTAAFVSLLITSQMSHAEADDAVFIPAFEFQDWSYQSFLIPPSPARDSAKPGDDVPAKKWAMGKLTLSDSPDGYAAAGFLDFAPGVQLRVTVKGTPGKGEIPATFDTTGVGEKGPTKGAEYQLTGWVFRGDDGKVESVRGSVRAVRGPDARPTHDLGGMPVGTVGAFIISKAK